jgi:hypothetical protein
MKRLLHLSMILLAITLVATACIPSQDDVVEILTSAEQTAAAQITYVPVTYTPDVSVIVAQTFAAMTAQAAGQSATVTPASPSSEAGSISGHLSYPSEFIPPLRVVAFNLFDQSYRYVDTLQNQSTYQIAGLAPGKYHVVAYVAGGGLAGGYSQMVPCGLSANCSDHSLIDVVVLAGADTPNIDPGDWYAPENAFPPMPEANVILPTATDDGPPALSGNGGFGGKLGYPSEGNPPMRIVAFRIDNMNEHYTIVTTQGQNDYMMSVPPGQYYVVAYTLGGGGFPSGLSGAYTQAVKCGMGPACTDHSLAPIQVSSMVVFITDANIYDWFLPDGIIPPNPYP